MCDNDAKTLIILVQERPVLWDKTLEEYRQKCYQECLYEICSALQADFDIMEYSEKNAFSLMQSYNFR